MRPHQRKLVENYFNFIIILVISFYSVLFYIFNMKKKLNRFLLYSVRYNKKCNNYINDKYNHDHINVFL